MEGALLLFKDKTEKYIFDDMYSNTWQIKSFLEKTVIEKQEYKKPENVKFHHDAIGFQNADDFKGMQWTSLRGISLWGLIGFFLLLFLYKGKTPTKEFWLFFLGFSSFWFFVNSWLMNYFSLTREYLIVKNYNQYAKYHFANYRTSSRSYVCNTR